MLQSFITSKTFQLKNEKINWNEYHFVQLISAPHSTIGFPIYWIDLCLNMSIYLISQLNLSLLGQVRFYIFHYIGLQNLSLDLILIYYHLEHLTKENWLIEKKRMEIILMKLIKPRKKFTQAFSVFQHISYYTFLDQSLPLI